MKRQSSPAVCFYFQVHQPYRLSDLRITDVGSMKPSEYFDEERNRQIFRKVAEKSYLPANKVILDLLEKNPNFSVAYSLSGVFLDQCREYGPDVLKSFQKLAATGRVEFLAETYYHSLSALFSVREFAEQVRKHVDTIDELFGVRPTVFRNTELVFSNEIAELVRLLGFKAILAEGADHVLKGRSPTQPYRTPKFALPKQLTKLIAPFRIHKPAKTAITVLLKHYHLSDDIAFRFGTSSRSKTPLTADTFADWVKATGGHSVNLFMDYETFGEHQWADTGIFDFLSALPKAFTDRGILTRTPSETAAALGRARLPVLDVHSPMSWADTERDLSAWRGNPLQEAALEGIYSLEEGIKSLNDPKLLETWRRLQTSDHFYYLCTKYWSDGDVHKYFSPYESPYEAYRRFSHALADLRQLLERAGASPSAH